jgi:hypothetical protein
MSANATQTPYLTTRTLARLVPCEVHQILHLLRTGRLAEPPRLAHVRIFDEADVATVRGLLRGNGGQRGASA